MNTEHKDKDTEHEHVVVEADSGWHVFVSEDDGELKINVPDHVGISVDGEPKNDPVVTVESREFPTQLEIDDSEESFFGHIRPSLQ